MATISRPIACSERQAAVSTIRLIFKNNCPNRSVGFISSVLLIIIMMPWPISQAKCFWNGRFLPGTSCVDPPCSCDVICENISDTCRWWRTMQWKHSPCGHVVKGAVIIGVGCISVIKVSFIFVTRKLNVLLCFIFWKLRNNELRSHGLYFGQAF